MKWESQLYFIRGYINDRDRTALATPEFDNALLEMRQTAQEIAYIISIIFLLFQSVDYSRK